MLARTRIPKISIRSTGAHSRIVIHLDNRDSDGTVRLEEIDSMAPHALHGGRALSRPCR